MQRPWPKLRGLASFSFSATIPTVPLPPSPQVQNEAQRLIGAGWCVRIAENIARKPLTNLSGGKPDRSSRGPREQAAACSTILLHGAGCWFMAGTYVGPDEEDEEGAATGAHRRLNQGDVDCLGRLRPSNARSRPQNQCQAAETGRRHHQGAVTRRTIPALQTSQLQRRRLHQRQRGELRDAVHAERSADARRRCVWEKAKAPLTTGRQGWPSTRSSSRSGARCTRRWFEMPSVWRGTSCPVSLTTLPVPCDGIL